MVTDDKKAPKLPSRLWCNKAERGNQAPPYPPTVVGGRKRAKVSEQ